MDRCEDEHENIRVATNPVPDAAPERCRLELFSRECDNIAVPPAIQVANSLVVEQMLASPIVERCVGQYADKVAQHFVLNAGSWQIRLVSAVVPDHEQSNMCNRRNQRECEHISIGNGEQHEHQVDGSCVKQQRITELKKRLGIRRRGEIARDL